MNTRKKYMLAVGLAFGMSLCAAVQPAPFVSSAAAHFMTSAEEHEIGRAAVERFEEKNDVAMDDDLITIQQRLIASNPEHLNWNDGLHKRWLAPMKMYHSDVPNAFMLPGGYGYMADSMVNFMNTYQCDGYVNYNRMRRMNGIRIYNTSAVAFVMAHEFGHWAGKDHLESYDKQYGLNIVSNILGALGGSVSAMTARQIGINLVDTLWERKMSLSQEMGADEWGLQFLENVPEYSTGGALIKFDRFLRLEEIRYPDGKFPKNYRNPHPGTEKRFDRAMDYIRKTSNNRVMVLSSELYIDGQRIPVYGREDIVKRERVFYLAGQIAAAIKYDMFHERCVRFVPVAQSPVADDPDRHNEGYLVVVNDDRTMSKFLDKFRYDTSRSFEENMAVTMYANGDMETLGSIVDAMNLYDAKNHGK